MENAGRGIAQLAMDILEDVAGKRIIILCGPGNNGGDGYVVARHLLNHGALARTLVLAPEEKIKGDARTNLDILKNMEHPVKFVDEFLHLDEEPDLIIDAMLGTGVTGSLRGIFADAAKLLDQLRAPVLAVDIPTGVNADTGAVDGPAVQASYTATMALPKRGLLFSPGREYTGELYIIDIGMPPAVQVKKDTRVFQIDETDVRLCLPFRAPDAYKNSCGTCAVVAGSAGLAGAAVMTSLATMRAGAGMTFLAAPSSINSSLRAQLTEIITEPLDDAGSGCFTSDHFEPLMEFISQKDVAVLGPGLGQKKVTVQLIHQLLTNLDQPLVLDADGLNACRDHIGLIQQYPNELIITPHPGELSRLIDASAKEITADPITIARQAAKDLQCVLILKGAPTVIAVPDGTVFVNSTGNAGMATAGSGDVLTGALAGLLAQDLEAIDAAIAGVFLHGVAGDFAAQDKGMHGMMATDILHQLPLAIKGLYENV